MTDETTNEESAPPDPPDAALVERARTGDTAAYDELIRRYSRKIHGLVYGMTSNREDTEDLVQNVFIKAYRSLPDFRGQSSFYTWIYRIAVNYTLNHLKRRKPAALSLDDADQGVERNDLYVELVSRDSPVRQASLGELQKRLNKALEKLSEKHRTVVVLHDIQGVPHEEIARMMGTSNGTVRSRLFYARKILQNELSEFAP